MEDEKRKFSKCIDILKKNLKDELISVPQGALEVPLTIAIKRNIKKLEGQLKELEEEQKNSEDGQDKKWKSNTKQIEKLEMNLKNIVLNIEFRKSVILEGSVK